MENTVTQTIDSLKTNGGLNVIDIANIANVSKAAVLRWTLGRVSPYSKTQLILSDLQYVIDRLSEFYNPIEIRTWLHTRNDLLNGESAAQLIHNERTEEVLYVIDSMCSLEYQ